MHVHPCHSVYACGYTRLKLEGLDDVALAEYDGSVEYRVLTDVETSDSGSLKGRRCGSCCR